MSAQRRAQRLTQAGQTANRIQVLLKSNSTNGFFKWNPPQARHEGSDSEWPLSSHSASDGLRLPSSFEQASQERRDRLEDEGDEQPQRRLGKRKRTAPQFQNCVWAETKPCCSARKFGRLVKTGCGGTPAATDYSPAAVMRIRGYFHKLTEHERRGFVSNRMRLEKTSTGSNKHAFYLEDPALLENTVFCPLTLRAPMVGLRKVCGSFFKWCTGASNNLVYQPASGSKTFLVDRATRSPRARPKYASCETWLEDLSKYYQISPDSDFVFLPMANKSAVWELFKRDMKEKGKDAGSENYFMKTWRKSPALQNIRIRKYLRFAKCDDCVEFRLRHVDNMDREKRTSLQ